MIIVYNPPNGAPVQNFIFKGSVVEPHLVGELKQYEDTIGRELVDTFGFLQILDQIAAKAIMDAPKEPKFKCEYCDFKTDKNIALMGHMRKHADEIKQRSEPVVDPSIIPVAKVSNVVNNEDGNDIRQSLQSGKDIPNGEDRDGVSWYGTGLQEDNSFSRVRPVGKAHFVPSLD